MAQNLNYNAPGNSLCFNNDPANCVTYGKLYDWNTIMQGAAASAANPSGVQGICPKGWHVPSLAEWVQLFNFYGGQDSAGGVLKATTNWQSPNSGATNSSGLSILGAGAGTIGSPNYFGGSEQEAAFLTTSLDPANTLKAYWLYFPDNSGTITTGDTDESKTLLSSCRCVKDP